MAGRLWSLCRNGGPASIAQAVRRRWPLVRRIMTGPVGPGAMVLDPQTDLGVFGGDNIEECIDPENASSTRLALHLAPYRYAMDDVKGKDVLEAGCNWGYGSSMLSRAARRMAAYQIRDYLIDIGTPANYAAAQRDWPRVVSHELQHL